MNECIYLYSVVLIGESVPTLVVVLLQRLVRHLNPTILYIVHYFFWRVLIMKVIVT